MSRCIYTASTLPHKQHIIMIQKTRSSLLKLTCSVLCISTRYRTQCASSCNTFSFNPQKHRRYLFVHSVPGEPTSGKKGKLMVAFTHHEPTCSAVNMCCYLTYYMTDMSVFLLHALITPPFSSLWVWTGCGSFLAAMHLRCCCSFHKLQRLIMQHSRAILSRIILPLLNNEKALVHTWSYWVLFCALTCW